MATKVESKRLKPIRHINVSLISSEEKAIILRARKLTGKDLPTFYHDGIVDTAREVVRLAASKNQD